MSFLSLAALVLAVLATACAFGVIFFALYVTIIGQAMGAPFVRSRKEKIARMIEFSEITAEDSVMDLGSGDGSLVIAASRAGAREAIGIETNPLLVWYSRWRLRQRRVSPDAPMGASGRIIRGNFYRMPLAGADVVFLYLVPRTMEKIREKMDRELKHGTRVVSNAFPIPGWIPARQEDGVFLYHFGRR
ncbi:MAG: 50S ribosomal protein L11 methyltransferase [Patescibacteria group bacterium]